MKRRPPSPIVRKHLAQLRRNILSACAAVEKLETVSVKDAAELLRVTPETVREKLPVIKYGPKTHRVLVADIEALNRKAAA